MFDLVFGFPLAEFALPAPAGGTQNLVSAVDVSADGLRAAFGMWGNTSDPEVVVLEIGNLGPALAIKLPGSVRGLDLDPTGTRVAIAHKNVHSSTFGARGTVRLVDTGERGIQLLETPRLGGELTAAAQRPGSSLGWFLMGPRSATPLFFPGVSTPLLIERGRVQVHARVPDANGRIDFAMPVPNTPGLRGMQMHLQGAFRTPQGLEFTTNLVSPFLLD